jgi:hypothetical protein
MTEGVNFVQFGVVDTKHIAVTTVADGVACQSSCTPSRDKTKQANDGVAPPVDIEAEFEVFVAAMLQLAARQADVRGRRAPSDRKRRGPQPSISV